MSKEIQNFDCCLQGFYIFLLITINTKKKRAIVHIFFIKTDFVGFRGVSHVGSGDSRFGKQALAYSTKSL